MTTQQQVLDHGIFGFAVALPETPQVCSFAKIIPLTDDAEITAITWPTRPIDANVDYHGDNGILNLPLVKGAIYPIAGTSITMAAGAKAMLILREALA